MDLISPHQQEIICENKSMRHKTMGEVESPTKWRDRRVERWHDKRMRKDGCNLGNKKIMNNSYCEASQTRKTSSKREGPSRVIYPSSYGDITLQ